MESVRYASSVEKFELAGQGLILLAAFASFVLSVTLWFTSHHDEGIFVGLWVPSILSLGALRRGRAQ